MSKTSKLTAFFEKRIASIGKVVETEGEDQGKRKPTEEQDSSKKRRKVLPNYSFSNPIASTESVKQDTPQKVEESVPKAHPTPRRSNTIKKRGSLMNTQRINKRIWIIMEIQNTESTYIESLSSLIRVCLRPLQGKNILTPEEINLIFMNIEVIFNYNTELLKRLAERTSAEIQSDDIKIGDIFVALLPYFKAYSYYVCNHTHATKAVDEFLETKAKFKSFIEESRSNPAMKGHNIKDVLIMPVQRIPRYRLLLQDLVKCTSIDHPDYENLSKALKEVSDLTNELNEKLRDNENQRFVIQLQNSFVDPHLAAIVEPHRRLIREVSLKYRNLADIKNDTSELKTLHCKPCKLYLFNDLCVLAWADDKGKLNLISKLPLKSLFPKEEPLDPLSLYLVSAETNTECVVCNSEDESKELRLLIEEQIRYAAQKYTEARGKEGPLRIHWLEFRKNIQLWQNGKGLWQAGVDVPTRKSPQPEEPRAKDIVFSILPTPPVTSTQKTPSNRRGIFSMLSPKVKANPTTKDKGIGRTTSKTQIADKENIPIEQNSPMLISPMRKLEGKEMNWFSNEKVFSPFATPVHDYPSTPINSSLLRVPLFAPPAPHPDADKLFDEICNGLVDTKTGSMSSKVSKIKSKKDRKLKSSSQEMEIDIL